MKRLLIFVVLLFICGVAIAQLEMTEFKDDYYGISIQYPSDWRQEDPFGDQKPILKVASGSGFNRKLIKIEVVSEGASKHQLDAYYKSMADDFKSQGHLIGFEFLNDQVIDVDGTKGLWLAILHKTQAAFAVEDIYIFAFPKKSFILTFRAAGETKEKAIKNMNDSRPLFEKAFKSLRFNKKEVTSESGKVMFQDVVTGKVEYRLAPDKKSVLDLSGDEYVVGLILGILITWGWGLCVPLTIRYLVLKRPINKSNTLIIVGTMWFLNIAIFTILGSMNKSHMGAFLVAFASYYILNKGYAEKSKEI